MCMSGVDSREDFDELRYRLAAAEGLGWARPWLVGMRFRAAWRAADLHEPGRWSRGSLARAIPVSAAALAGFMSGGPGDDPRRFQRIAAAKLRSAADLLRVEPEWMLDGEVLASDQDVRPEWLVSAAEDVRRVQHTLSVLWQVQDGGLRLDLPVSGGAWCPTWLDPNPLTWFEVLQRLDQDEGAMAWCAEAAALAAYDDVHGPPRLEEPSEAFVYEWSDSGEFPSAEADWQDLRLNEIARRESVAQKARHDVHQLLLDRDDIVRAMPAALPALQWAQQLDEAHTAEEIEVGLPRAGIDVLLQGLDRLERVRRSPSWYALVDGLRRRLDAAMQVERHLYGQRTRDGAGRQKPPARRRRAAI